MTDLFNRLVNQNIRIDKLRVEVDKLRKAMRYMIITLIIICLAKVGIILRLLYC